MVSTAGETVSTVDVSSIAGWAQGNQGMIGIFGWAILALYALVRVCKAKFGGEFDWGRVGNSLQVALGTTGWRWGTDDGKPTGKSIVLERADGNRLVANFKTGKYFLNTKGTKTNKEGKVVVSFKENELNGMLSKKQVKKLNALRDKVVSALKATDDAAAKAKTQQKNDELVAQLTRFNGNRA